MSLVAFFWIFSLLYHLSGYSYREVRFWNPAFLQLKNNIRHRYICVVEEIMHRKLEILVIAQSVRTAVYFS